VLGGEAATERGGLGAGRNLAALVGRGARSVAGVPGPVLLWLRAGRGGPDPGLTAGGAGPGWRDARTECGRGKKVRRVNQRARRKVREETYTPSA
jgi:hypothetical protein